MLSLLLKSDGFKDGLITGYFLLLLIHGLLISKQIKHIDIPRIVFMEKHKETILVIFSELGRNRSHIHTTMVCSKILLHTPTVEFLQLYLSRVGCISGNAVK